MSQVTDLQRYRRERERRRRERQRQMERFRRLNEAARRSTPSPRAFARGLLLWAVLFVVLFMYNLLTSR
ncbi:MAG: hypothetical protein IMW98_00510 [Firmicutes bacterium]|nr:hypothetical protein [Bacillota bacterium]